MPSQVTAFSPDLLGFLLSSGRPGIQPVPERVGSG